MNERQFSQFVRFTRDLNDTTFIARTKTKVGNEILRVCGYYILNRWSKQKTSKINSQKRWKKKRL